MTGQGGFQPRNTPAERRAFFDINRRLREMQAQIDAGGGGGGPPVWTDGFPTYDPRYVNIPGDVMTGALTIGGAAPQLILSPIISEILLGDIRIVTNAAALSLIAPGVGRQITFDVSGVQQFRISSAEIMALVDSFRVTAADAQRGFLYVGSGAANQALLAADSASFRIGPTGSNRVFLLTTAGVERLRIVNTLITSALPIQLPADPVAALQAATKQYVDLRALASRVIATTLPLTGGGDLTADRTLAIVTFAGSAAGAVPPSAGGTVNFLRADGAWAAPPAGGGPPTWSDGFPTYDPRYVDVAGDVMTGALKIWDTTQSNLIRLVAGPSGSGVNATILARNDTDAASIGRLSFFQAGGVVLASMVTGEPVKLVVDNLDKLIVDDTLTTSANPVVLPADPAVALHAATKQYVDAQVAAALATATTPVSGTITPTASWATPGGFVTSLFKVGKIVVLNIALRNGTGSTTAANPQIATIPAGFRPGNLVRVGAHIGTAAAGGIQVSAAGAVQAVHAGVPANNDVCGTVVYEQVN